MSSFDNKSFAETAFPERNWFIVHVVLPVDDTIRLGVLLVSRIATKIKKMVKI